MENPLLFTIKLVHEVVNLVTDSYMKLAIDYFEVTRARPYPFLCITYFFTTMDD